MDAFPYADPIPLPGPVWLFKLLHIVTIELHFFAVFLLAGGLFLTTWWGLRGKPGSVQCDARGVLSYRLPIVMAYVVNLGVPPLLFSQVLYGRALYTSSILMGVFWFAVIFLLMAAYFILYRMSYMAEYGRAHFFLSLIASLLVLKIGFIYSHNMTLMLRPESWLEMYRGNPTGAQLDGANPLDTPRWLFMMLSALMLTGIWLRILAKKNTIAAETAAFLDARGRIVLRMFAPVVVLAAYWVLHSQPAEVQQTMGATGLARGALWLWLLSAGALFALSFVRGKDGAAAHWYALCGSGAVAFVNVLALVVYRDVLRDVHLGLYDFDVWDRVVNANWVVIGLFLVLFVVMATSVGWMISVVARAKGVDEHYA